MYAIAVIALALSAIYCGGAWLYLAYYAFAHKVDVERETFHLGLCFILAVGFLGLIAGGS